MRFLTIFMSRLRLFDPVMRAAQHNDALQNALLDAVLAHDTYRNVLLNVMKPHSISTILLEMVKSFLALPFISKHNPNDAYQDKTSK